MKSNDNYNRILIVDDCAFNLQAMEGQLQIFDLQTDMVEDGEKACQKIIERLQSKEPMYELILLDYSMPVMDGP